MWERFFNWQTDMDWAWGPLVSLRPPRDQPMQPWVWARLFLVFTLLGVGLMVLGAVTVVLLPKWAAREQWAVPPGIAETLATLSAMGADRGFRWAVAGLGLSLPGLFFLVCLPFHLAWNKRAARLAALPPGEAVPPPSHEAQSDVWPPAPKIAD